MLRNLAGLKIAAVCAGLLVVAGCSSQNRPDIAAEQTATPGSERDFIVNVGDRVHFIVDQSTLTPEGQETLRRQAAWLRQYPQIAVQIEGHSDERGTREYNIALSARRAAATQQFLIQQGVSRAAVDGGLRQGAAGGPVRRRIVLEPEPPRGDGDHLGRGVGLGRRRHRISAFAR
jgi:peptidoglycan-associated lipoprotein